MIYNVVAEECVYVVSVTVNPVSSERLVNVMRVLVSIKILDFFAPGEEPVVVMVSVHVM